MNLLEDIVAEIGKHFNENYLKSMSILNKYSPVVKPSIQADFLSIQN